VSVSPLPDLPQARAHELIDRFTTRRITVVGDVMLDRFLIGRVSRMSPEAPVPVVVFDHEEFRLGGAANVAHNLRALGASVDLIGVIGNDESGALLKGELAAKGLHATGLITDLERRTTTKMRVVTTRNQQVARIDYEHDGEIGEAVEATVVQKVSDLAAAADAIVVSDYMKGVISPRVAAAAAKAANDHDIPLLVDPKVPHIEYYAGATVITPNHHEAEMVTHMRIRTDADAREAARRFRDRSRCTSVLITRGEHGMWLLAGSASDGESMEMPLPAEAREVADVTGAGDTVISALALAFAAGATLEDAARLANRAAGIVVGKFGPATVTVDEIRALIH
jgi:D-beta-D-heptose 7-phosphate kinase/D-beta-D-heptose 1-phosphate adenosyltransferase